MMQLFNFRLETLSNANQHTCCWTVSLLAVRPNHLQVLAVIRANVHVL